MNSNLLAQGNKYGILYIDTEHNSLKHFTKMFSSKFSIFTALTAQEGLLLLKENRERIGIVMGEYRMPGEKGLRLLEKIKQIAPEILRILVTAYTDLETTIGAINSGKIYKYIAKPWEANKVEAILWEGLNSFTLQKQVYQILNQDFSLLKTQLIHSRTEAMAPLMAGIAGEIRSNVEEIDAFLKKMAVVIRKENKDADRIFSQLKKINQSSVKKIYEICSLLEEAKKVRRYPLRETIQLSEAIDKAILRHKKKFHEKHITTNNTLSSNLPPLRADKKQFNKLLDLLFKTEIIALPNNGAITIEGSLRKIDANKKVLEINLKHTDFFMDFEIFGNLSTSKDLTDFQVCETYLSYLAAFFIVRDQGGSIQVENKDNAPSIRLSFPLHPAACKDDTADIFTVLFLKKSKKFLPQRKSHF